MSSVYGSILPMHYGSNRCCTTVVNTSLPDTDVGLKKLHCRSKFFETEYSFLDKTNLETWEERYNNNNPETFLLVMGTQNPLVQCF